MYYAGLRPAEAVAVTLPDCDLPATGWGTAVLHATRPSVGKKWTDSGRNHDLRGLKSRPPSDTRVVPLPPELVRLWRESVDTFGTAAGGRLFFNEKGGIVGSSTYDRAWRETRERALPPDLVASPFAVRPAIQWPTGSHAPRVPRARRCQRESRRIEVNDQAGEGGM